MQKILQCKEQLTKQQNSKLLKMFISFKKQNLSVHNLTNIKIPGYISFILSFGLNFCLLKPFSFERLKNDFNEILRKISWVTLFKQRNEESVLSDFDRLLINIKKYIYPLKMSCHIQNDIFPDLNITQKFMYLINRKYKKENFIPPEVLVRFQDFFIQNNLIVKNADKNAGICIMHKTDYDNEILRQLHDENIYQPSTKSHFHQHMEEFTDRLKCMKIQFSDKNSTKLTNLINFNYRPANFYILPKIHKDYEIFPVGRPISSTCNTINKYLCQLVDYILKPVMTFIPNLVIDTSHLLLLLDNLNLRPDRKYVLITYDISSMYTSLKLKNCKMFCIRAYEMYKKYLSLPYNFTSKQFKELLDLCLDYNHLEFNNFYYKQVQGIQMGNSASVTIANITAFYELHSMFKNHLEIVFNARFVDDGLLIVRYINN